MADPRDRSDSDAPPAGDRFGATRFGGEAGAEAPAEKRPFTAGTRVRVTRLRTRQPGSERTGELGAGRLTEEPAVGSALRIELESGPALVTSPVRSLVAGGAVSLEAITANSAYRIEKLTLGSATGLPPRQPSAPAAEEVSLPEIELETSADGTRYLSLTELAEDSEDAPFGAGTKVRIERRKSAQPKAPFETVGSGQILDPLTVGQPARLAIDGGFSFVTSRLKSVRLLDDEALEFETSNTLYRLQKIGAD